MIEPQATAKGLGVGRLQCGADVQLYGDPDKVLQIVLNLLSNAIKFTDSGGTLSVSCASSDDITSIMVRDTGRGIPTGQLQAIFEPFVQVGRRLSALEQGVGLGLAISRDLARAMGGDLTAESEVGVGSTFTLTLPRV
jgi:signal transduction histidine kinase